MEQIVFMKERRGQICKVWIHFLWQVRGSVLLMGLVAWGFRHKAVVSNNQRMMLKRGDKSESDNHSCWLNAIWADKYNVYVYIGKLWMAVVRTKDWETSWWSVVKNPKGHKFDPWLGNLRSHMLQLKSRTSQEKKKEEPRFWESRQPTPLRDFGSYLTSLCLNFLIS